LKLNEWRREKREIDEKKEREKIKWEEALGIYMFESYKETCLSKFVWFTFHLYRGSRRLIFNIYFSFLFWYFKSIHRDKFNDISNLREYGQNKLHE
jgi:hypothetical protein